MNNLVNENKQNQIDLISLMKKHKDKKGFIDTFISLYTNEELYRIMRHMQSEIRQRNIMEL